MTHRPSRRHGTDDSRTSGDTNQPRGPAANRSATGEQPQPRSRGQPGGNETVSSQRSSGFVPRAPERREPAGTDTYNSTSAQSSNYDYGSSQPKTAERPEPIPQHGRTTAQRPEGQRPGPATQNTSSVTQRPESTPEPAPGPELSEILRPFLRIPLRDYKKCEKHCIGTPAIWSQDIEGLRKLAIIYIRGKLETPARLCAERWLMIMIAQQRKLTAADANAFLKSLSKNDKVFQDQLNVFMTKWSADDNGTQTVVSPPENHQSRSPTASNKPIQPTPRELTTATRTGFPSTTQHERLPTRTLPPYTQRGIHPTETPDRTPQTQDPHTGGSQIRNEDAAPGVEEISDLHTVDDNITLGEQEREERGISERSSGLGPNLSLISSRYEERDTLDDSYWVRRGRDAVEFFIKGRVFAVVWHENVGIPANPNAVTATTAPLDKPFHRHTINADGVAIFSHIRRFVIVKAKVTRRYCLAIPINSYRDRGLTDKNMRMDEKQAHTIIHDSERQPQRTHDEVKLHKEPIAVKLVEGEVLKPSSRLHFGKMQTIEWNVRVKDVGFITDPKHIRRLTLYFIQEFEKGEDTATETEGKQRRR